MTSTDRNRSKSETARASEPRSQEPHELSEECSHTLALTVVFTNVSGTLAALREAAHWAHQLGAHIRILVAHVVPYPLPLDKPAVDPEFRLRPFYTLCEKVPVETHIDVRLCRDTGQCMQEALVPQSLVLIGGRSGWWPFTREKCLVRCLQRAGHQVVFVVDEK